MKMRLKRPSTIDFYSDFTDVTNDMFFGHIFFIYPDVPGIMSRTIASRGLRSTESVSFLTFRMRICYGIYFYPGRHL
jgi:hypothetical protein